ncbi:NAD(P)-dependent dehydrogenase (short-subunit alcohol dehydrogenase family) [Nocardioides ginsengisegetis]|uniref:NAD(P)-dependent dehydrogenase (Short-subunit alcohol dehydrogenase family) n=1 Tax=Nocardioides ginsengisegetis TaxID=661491 RepID=A0A7W3J2F1_9ACTN|nr:SDR family oxidoreductase [Nocardioides ginsengisegetis]MBA8804924.1 NAD(P)-dependent dehydrogenase (short-subunit alcohol dehydrogenase family) [Nocardioides ginsengisegetis]
MEDVLGYAGKQVVVTGAASGMGAATARILTELGARVTALDIKPTEVAVERSIEVDLRDPDSIDAAAAAIDGPVDGLFSCAGLPGPPFSELDTMLVNFVGARHLAERLVPLMPPGSAITCISSSAARGWEKQVPLLTELITTDSFEAAVEWLLANEEKWNWSGYLFSKWTTDAWVSWWYADLAADGIRINCINPGPTDTAMMPAFQDFATKEVVDTSMGPVGRYATADEQAWPVVMLGSPRSGYVAGTVLWTDGGWNGAMNVKRRAAEWAQRPATVNG